MKKKVIIIILAVCIVIAGIAGFILGRDKAPAEAKPTESAEEATPEEIWQENPQSEEAAIEFKTLDTDALYASRDADEIVARINGNDIRWEDYFYNIFSQAMQVQEYFKGMGQYYGMALDWDQQMDENGTTYAVSAVDSAEQALIQFEAIKGFAKENNVVLDEEIQNTMKAQHEADRKALCGEDATEEDFAEYLQNIYMSVDMYDEMNRINNLYRQSFIQLYGEDGEKLSDEAALKFLTDGKYMYANHILLSTVNLETGEALDEATVKEKEAKAAELSAELRAISDTDKLLERFGQLKEEFCEDSGKSFFPEGMTFVPGAMVKEFEDGVAALEEYQVSEPVKSDFGYHVIIRLPLDPDAVLEYTQMGTPVSARGAASNVELNERFQKYFDSLSIEYAEGFEKPDLMKYIK